MLSHAAPARQRKEARGWLDSCRAPLVPSPIGSWLSSRVGRGERALTTCFYTHFHRTLDDQCVLTISSRAPCHPWPWGAEIESTPFSSSHKNLIDSTELVFRWKIGPVPIPLSLIREIQSYLEAISLPITLLPSISHGWRWREKKNPRNVSVQEA